MPSNCGVYKYLFLKGVALLENPFNSQGSNALGFPLQVVLWFGCAGLPGL